MLKFARLSLLAPVAFTIALVAPIAAQAGGGKPSKPVVTKPEPPSPAPSSQSLGMMGGAYSGAIKAIGSGLSTLARK